MSELGKPLCVKNKVALITGGGSGVGLECARLFSAAKAKIMLVGSNSEKLASAASLLNSENIAHFAGDVRDPCSADQAFAEVKRAFGAGVDILINNAGTILRATAEDTNNEDWQRVMDINVNGVFYFSRVFARQDIENGAIVNVSSTCAQVGAAGLAAYCASKGAVDQLTRSMALELAARKITVNAVAPGAINSPMLYSKHADEVSSESIVENNLESIPIGSIAEPAEVARAIHFLATERHLTGTILTVDGGYTAQ